MADLPPEESDLNAKLRLEAILRPKVRRVQNATVRELVRSLGSKGNLPNIAAIEAAAFEPILRQHFDDTARVFDHRLGDQLPEDVAVTEDELVAIAAGLVIFFDEQAALQAEVIGETSAKNAIRSVELAKLESQRKLDDEGQTTSRRAEAIIAGTLFNRFLAGRLGTIVSLGTQSPAEAAKTVEARVLLDARINLVQGSVPTETITEVNQRWVTQGDNRVRPAHRAADGQVRTVGEAFDIGGERLLYPGDTSLGASIGNVANCRCSAVQDVTQVVQVRRAA